jgi:acetylglutamate kinase
LKVTENNKRSKNSPIRDGDLDSLLVIKIGGNIIDDDEKLSSFLKNFASISEKKILIHGGGKLATKMAGDLGIPQKMIDGRRITDAETLKIVTMVYGGYINKKIVSQLQANDCNAIGLSGADGNLIQAHKRVHPTIDYGFAGDIDIINLELLKSLLDQGMSIVIAPITHNKNGQLLNTNADTIAQEIARSLSAAYAVNLIYSFEKSGVLLNTDDETSVIPSIRPDFYEQLKAEKKIFAGMIPKIDNAFAALRSGVKEVTIGKAEELQKLIQHQAGTRITNE